MALEATLVDGTPAALNAMIESGKLDMSSSSSLLYLSRSDLDLIPHLSISSYGPVGSVLFFSKTRPEELSGRRIAVPRASATSIRLLSLILKVEYNCDVELVMIDRPGLDDEFSGALVIGDEALRVDDEWSARSHRIDLGEWWTRRMKLPMVFGVFVARKEYIEQFPRSYRHVEESLKTARQIGTTEMLDQVIDRAAAMTGLLRPRMEKYFVENLNWRLDEKHRESLCLFGKLLRENKLL